VAPDASTSNDSSVLILSSGSELIEYKLRRGSSSPSLSDFYRSNPLEYSTESLPELN
jgi:hypothetical protein